MISFSNAILPTLTRDQPNQHPWLIPGLHRQQARTLAARRRIDKPALEVVEARGRIDLEEPYLAGGQVDAAVPAIRPAVATSRALTWLKSPE